MKRNLLGLFAVVLAIAVSSFTAKKTTDFYYIYPGSGAENSFAIYSTPVSSADVEDNVGTITLNWLRVVDNDATPDASTFASAFNSYDIDHDGKLSDELVTEDPSKFDLE